MNGSMQLALVFSGNAKHPHRSIQRAIRRFERWDTEGWLYSAQRYTLRAVELFLPADLQVALAAIQLPASPCTLDLANAYLAQHVTFRRKHRAPYEQALARWRFIQFEEWAITFDFAERAGYRLTKKQCELKRRVHAALSEGRP